MPSRSILWLVVVIFDPTGCFRSWGGPTLLPFTHLRGPHFLFFFFRLPAIDPDLVFNAEIRAGRSPLSCLEQSIECSPRLVR